ncbi:MAG: hypothetical protein O9302_01775 [Cyclobacteriaceae bacterium]|jgi:hypothetical protein|nr:hypothetical protein [Cytophagales bacterium]MCZ8326761.1 hypothetical protein [Cyclobacteriaceae bacterium]
MNSLTKLVFLSLSCKKVVHYFCISFACTLFYFTSYAQVKLKKENVKTNQLKPAILYWEFGSPEFVTIETIYPSKDSVATYWNVTHRSPTLNDAENNGFDYYMIKEKTLQPVISHMYHLGFTNYQISVKKDSAWFTIKSMHDTVSYALPVPEFIIPDGPGLPVFIGSLPLTKGYSIEYPELSRWSGKAPYIGEVVTTKLEVVGTDNLEIEGKRYATYKLTISSDQGRFTELWVLKNKPHYPVKINHKIDSNRMMKSNVVKLILFTT